MHIWKKEVIPEQWKETVIIQSYKGKKDRKDKKNVDNESDSKKGLDNQR